MCLLSCVSPSINLTSNSPNLPPEFVATTSGKGLPSHQSLKNVEVDQPMQSHNPMPSCNHRSYTPYPPYNGLDRGCSLTYDNKTPEYQLCGKFGEHVYKCYQRSTLTLLLLVTPTPLPSDLVTSRVLTCFPITGFLMMTQVGSIMLFHL